MNHLQLRVPERRSLLMMGDAMAILLAVLIAQTMGMIIGGQDLDLHFFLTHAHWFPILAGIWLLLAHANDFYDLRFAARLDASLKRLLLVSLQSLLVYLIIFFVLPSDDMPRVFILYFGILSFAFMALQRLWRPRWIHTRRRVLIVGNGTAVQLVIEALRQQTPQDYEIVGVVPIEDTAGSETRSPTLGPVTHLLDIARREDITEIILANEHELSPQALAAVVACYEQGLSTVPMPVLYEQITGRVPIDLVGPNYGLLSMERVSIFAVYPLLKRGMDLLIVLIGLVVCLPLIPLIALIIYLDSPGPIFYGQERVGKGGRTFKMWKFRSMIPNAEAHCGPRWATGDDPRITRVGRILRKTRLDEIPQIYNVLRGEMSIIGPRPERPEFVAELNETLPYFPMRHAVKPGITGWAQVRYSYAGCKEEAAIKLEYDLYYIRHRSIWLDLIILLRTPGKMISFQGR
jgi:exopolysaccharide biosynthesis polyprenyl glycosylphosphotransferase